MTTFQKIIKYASIAFAIYLAITIISAIVFGLTVVFGIVQGVEKYQENQSENVTKYWTQEYSDIENLKIDLSVCKLEIKKGDKLKIETFNTYEEFECKVENGTLKIEDKKVNVRWNFNNDLVQRVVIYIPENITFDKIDITSGVNDTNIEYLNADKLELKVGVGKCYISNIIAKKAKIECGAGETIINDSEIETLKLNSGIGKLIMTSEITENADVDCGIGKLELNLKGDKSQYKVKPQTGLGDFTVNGNKVSDNEIIGDGNVIIEVDAGVGETVIKNIEN